VKNYDDIIGGYEPWRKDLMLKAQEKLKQFDNYLSSPNWFDLENNVKEKLKIQLMDTENKRQAVRGVCEVPHSVTQITRMIWDPKYRNTYDPMYEEGGMTRKVGPNTYLLY
jgi:hypothetical protein